jgi:DNA recombination protein RmuC
MDIGLIIIILLLLVAIVLIVVALSKMGKKEDNSGQELLLQQLNELSRTVDTKIGESSKMMSESVSDQFSKSQDLIRNINESMTKHLLNVTKGVTESNEASKQVFTVAESLKSLEQVLKHGKQRGNLGEASLELILSNMLPPTGYKSQYQFENGEVVDVAILAKEGVIPVDAKFSLDNYNRLVSETDEIRKVELEKEFSKDLKKRIDETAKYIRPEEGTLPFAFMYIPAEGIYYDLLINEVGSVKANTRSLIDYAYNDKKVIIVSPTTFSAYLQSVLYGFKAFKIEESAQEIRKYVGELSKHLKAYEEYHEKLGNTLSTAVNHYNRTGTEFKKVDKDILKITGTSMEIESIKLEKPTSDE